MKLHVYIINKKMKLIYYMIILIILMLGLKNKRNHI